MLTHTQTHTHTLTLSLSLSLTDGKQYDAYVCYPCEGQGISMTMTFALRILPEVLENKHGYKLFIRGRDD